jgi:sulfur-oxidizing protein SoxY
VANRPASPCRSRRRLLAAGAGLGLTLLVRPVPAAAAELADAIRAYTGDAAVRTGKVAIEIAALVENGNAVPIAVSVASPMTPADHVTAIALFSEKNPERDIARFSLGPRAGRASVATRIRLATSQQLVAVARMSDGTCWSAAVAVVVTLAACIEGEG